METDNFSFVVCRCCGEKAVAITGVHLKKCSNFTTKQYRQQFPDAPFMAENLKAKCSKPGSANPNWRGGKTIKYCACGKKLSRHNRSGFCRPCSTRGERNPFYGKKHNIDTRRRMSAAQQLRDPQTRKWGVTDFKTASINGKKYWESLSSIEQEEIIERLIQVGRNAKRKTENTDIEQRVQSWLLEQKISFQSGVKCGRYTIDIVALDRYAIECHGDFWHANPSLYSSDWINPETRLSAQEKWDMDKKRQLFLEKNGYHYLALWESDILRNVDCTKNILYSYLNENLSKRKTGENVSDPPRKI